MEKPPRAPMPEADVSREAAAALKHLAGLILRWNSRINLIGGTDTAILLHRHVADSLQLLPLIPPGETPLADLGSGGGFPGLVLAIALTRPCHLVESDRRKAGFLQHAAAELGLPHVTVHAQRVEAVCLPPIAVLTARAFAPLTRLLHFAAPHLAPGAVAILPKGQSAEAELTAATTSWTFTAERFISRSAPDATILRLSGIRRAGT